MLGSVRIATILNLATLTQYFDSYLPDQTWYAVSPTIWSQVMLNLSIITACLPSLKRVLTDLQSGLAASSIPEGFEDSVSRKNSAALGYTSWIQAATGSKIGSNDSTTDQMRCAFPGPVNGNTTQHDLDDLKNGYRHHHGSDKNSSKTAISQNESVDRLTSKGIVQKVDYKAEFGDRCDWINQRVKSCHRGIRVGVTVGLETKKRIFVIRSKHRLELVA